MNIENERADRRTEPKEFWRSLAGMFPVYRSFLNLAGDPLFMNSASWVGARAISGFVRVGILLGVARAYGPAKFGQLSLALSMVEILRTFSEFGIDTISIRKFAQTAPKERTQLLAGVVGAKLLIATCFYCVGAGALLLLTTDRAEVELGAIVGFSLFFAGVLGALSSYLQSSFSMSRILRTTLLTSGASVCFASMAILGRASLIVVIVALPLADGLNLLLLWHRLGTPLRVRFGIQETLSLLRQSLPVGLVAILVTLYFRLDNLFVFKFAGESALGLYALSYRIIEPALMVPSSFSTTTYTLLSNAEHQEVGARQVMRILVRTMWPAYAFIVAAAMVLLFAGKPLLARFFASYLGAYPILLVLVLALAVRTVNVTLTTVLNSRAKYSLLAKITAINLATNLLLVIVLVPGWGALGAAWAAFSTEVLNVLMQLRSVASSLSLPVSPQMAVENLNVE